MNAALLRDAAAIKARAKREHARNNVPHQERIGANAGADKITKRAKVLCAACDKQLRHDQIKRHNRSPTCGSQSCLDRLDRRHQQR